MRETIRKPVEQDEYLTDEGCWILELSNDAEDPAVSIARARVPPGQTTKWHKVIGIEEPPANDPPKKEPGPQCGHPGQDDELEPTRARHGRRIDLLHAEGDEGQGRAAVHCSPFSRRYSATTEFLLSFA